MFSNDSIENVFNDVVTGCSEDGWYQLNMQYYDARPDIASTVLAGFSVARSAKETLVSRYKRLNNESRTLSQCPRKGVAVRQPSNKFYYDWLDFLIDTAFEHYGDVFGAENMKPSDALDIDHYAAGMHEHFQMPKMGMFAPFGRRSLTKSVNEYMRTAREDNSGPIPLAKTEVILKAMRRVRDEDLAGIPDGSLTCCSAEEAVYGSNIQGLATGYIQQARDLTLSVTKARELSKLYDFHFEVGDEVAQALVKLYEGKELTFDIAMNIVTNLKRIQVGGLELDFDNLIFQVVPEIFKKAKYRTINANDPVIQLAEATASIPFREAIKTQTPGIFYNTLFDPDLRWERIRHSQLVAEEMNATLFPFDYSLHDAHLHAEWMFNLIENIVKPKFREQDRPVIDLVAICLVYKIILAPKGNGTFTISELIGGLGSGDPWTNIIGTLGTRTVGYLLAEARPDVFLCNPELGFNNGDDAAYAVYKQAITTYGIKGVIRIANDIVNQVHYFFNESKLIEIELPGDTYVNHWEQYAIWYNVEDKTVKRHGSTLRYFGKIYSDEDSGREGALEGIIDQLSTINNTIGYVGDQKFSTTTMNLSVLKAWMENDSVLMSYVNKYHEAFFDRLVEDAVGEQKAKIAKSQPHLTDEELTERAERKILRHLGASGYDKSGLARVIHDKDFSFLSVTKLVGLGVAELSRIAATGKGRMLHYQVKDGKLQWLRSNAA